MADRTLAEAVADLRLSDRRLSSDQTNLRRRLLQFAQQLEQDMTVNVGIKVDEGAIVSEFAKLEGFAAQFAPTTKLHLDANDALNELIALQNVAQPIDVPVNVETQQATSEIDALASSTSERLGQAGEEGGRQIGSRLTTAMQGVVGTIGAVTGGFIATALVKGFDRLTTIRDATASLTVALGDATKAADLLDKVLGVVKGTPFNLDQFALAASNMVSFGIEAQKIPGYLTAIGEAAATRGSRANEFAQRLSTIFGQITTANRISGEELNQFSEAGVNALVILANAAGKTTSEMRDLISKGAVPAKQALDVLAEGILHGSTGVAGATNAFAGTMAKLRETLTGAIGGFSAATARFGVNVIEPFEQALIAGFTGATNVLDKLGAKLKASLSGLSDGDFVQGLIAAFKDLPNLVDKATSSLAKIGPALAPLGAILGASGLGQLKGIPVLGQLIPQFLTNPIIAATAAFALFTPEIRDELLPVVEKLSAVFLKLGTAAAGIAGKALDALTPVFVKLITVVDSLIPLVDAGADLAITLGSAVIPVLQLFANVIDKIPVGVLQALVVAFLAFKGLNASFGPLNKAADLLTRVGLSGTQASKAVSAAGLAIGGAFAGMALASEDSATRITGAIGSLGAIATGFAAGPIVGVVTTLGVAIGGIAGIFAANAEEERKLKQHTDDLTAALSKNTIEVLANKDALAALLATSNGSDATVQLLGEALLTTGEQGQKLAEALLALNLAASGQTGETNAVEVIQGIQSAGKDLSSVKPIIDQLTTAFGSQASLVARLLPQYKDLGDLLSDLRIGTLAFNSSDDSGLQLLPEEMRQLVEALNGKGLDAGQKTLLGAIIELENQAKSTKLGEIIRQELTMSSIKNDQFRIGLGIAENETHVSRTTKDTNELIKLRNAALVITKDRYSDIREQQIREGLQAQKFTEQQINDLFALANSSKVDILDLVDLGGLETQLRKSDAEVQAVADSVSLDIVPALSDAERAAKDFADATALSEGAFKRVNDEIERMKGLLDETQQAQDLKAALEGIGEGFSKIINESDIKAGEGLLSRISDQRAKVQELQLDVQNEFLDAQQNAESLKARIAEAKAAGAVRGAAGLQRELDKVFDDANKKQGQLANAQADLSDLEAKLSKLNLVPTTVKQQLEKQAQDAGISLFDLLIAGSTPEARDAFKAEIKGPIDEALATLDQVIKDHPERAVQASKALRDQLLFAFVSGGADPDTAQAIINKYFSVDALDTRLAEAARAQLLAFGAQLRNLTEQPGFQNQFFGGDIDLPTSLSVPETGEVKRTVEETQAALDKLHALEAKLTVLPFTSPEAVQVRDQIQELIDGQKPVDFTVRPRPLTVDQLSALFSTPVEVPVSIAAPPSNTLGGTPSGKSLIFSAFKDGGIRYPEDHTAGIHAPGAWRIFAEPETGGEGYVPMAPWKRDSSMQVMRTIADIFGYGLVPKDVKVPMPTAMAGARFGLSEAEADSIGRAVARHTKPSPSERAAAYAERYDAAVKVEAGAIVVQGESSPRRTARRVVSELADLAWRH